MSELLFCLWCRKASWPTPDHRCPTCKWSGLLTADQAALLEPTSQKAGFPHD